MSSGPDQVTSSTTTQPSPLLLPGIGRGALASTAQFNQIAGQSREGRERTEFGRGINRLGDRGAAGSPVVGAAQDLTQSTLQGDFLSPDSNPFLQGTFNRAADLTRGRLDTEFAGAGRNLGAARPARSEELQTLASNIFGGNFQAERDRQLTAANQAIPLANQDFTDINAQIDAANLPIDQLINRIGALAPAAGGTAVSSQPLFRTGLF